LEPWKCNRYSNWLQARRSKSQSSCTDGDRFSSHYHPDRMCSPLSSK
jgi:hypothetical protein